MGTVITVFLSSFFCGILTIIIGYQLIEVERELSNSAIPLGFHLYVHWVANIGDQDIAHILVTTGRAFSMVMVN